MSFGYLRITYYQANKLCAYSSVPEYNKINIFSSQLTHGTVRYNFFDVILE